MLEGQTADLGELLLAEARRRRRWGAVRWRRAGLCTVEPQEERMHLLVEDLRDLLVRGLRHLAAEVREDRAHQAEAVVNDAHTLYLIVDADNKERVESFMAPFAQAGTVDVLSASSCEFGAGDAAVALTPVALSVDRDAMTRRALGR